MRCGVDVVYDSSGVKKGFTGALSFGGVARKAHIFGEVLVTAAVRDSGPAGHRAAWFARPRSAPG